jgi:peptidoglycan/LPS O-acetylase OafA/YrhL
MGTKWGTKFGRSYTDLRRDRQMDEGARRSKAAAFVLLGLGFAFYLMFAVGELAGGDISGVQHLLPAAILAALLWLGRRRPRRAGIILLVLSVPFAVGYVALLVVRDLPLTWALVVALPPVVTGLLLVRAGREAGAR